jgi:hypothetical protein
LAHFVIDYGPEAHLLWVVFLDEGGACWRVPNPEVRMQSNWTFNRGRKNGFCCELAAPSRADTSDGMAIRRRVASVRPDQSFKGRQFTAEVIL